MRIAYFDCASGISGDMTLAALVDAGAPLEQIQAGIDSLKFPVRCALKAEEVKRRGFRALNITVEHEHEHAHRHLHHIVKMIEQSDLTAAQRELAVRIFTRLGEAEAFVHGTTIEKVHFHEVGAVDSIADIVGCAIGLDLLKIDRVECSPIPTGRGFVEIAHGRVSLPAPATAKLLMDIPLVPCDVEAELTTPTGAAIVAATAEAFGPLPAMKLAAIGLGAGDRDLEQQPNVLRLLIGETEAGENVEEIWSLETSLDDCSGETVGHCQSLLLEAGALDAYTTAIQMKKSRPGVLITVLCRAEQVEPLTAILFRETGTLGVRRQAVRRSLARRAPHEVQTEWGPILGKVSQWENHPPRFAPEYDCCAAVARKFGVALEVVYTGAERAFSEAQR